MYENFLLVVCLYVIVPNSTVFSMSISFTLDRFRDALINLINDNNSNPIVEQLI